MITSKESSLLIQEVGKIILDKHQTQNTAKMFYFIFFSPRK